MVPIIIGIQHKGAHAFTCFQFNICDILSWENLLRFFTYQNLLLSSVLNCHGCIIYTALTNGEFGES